MPLPRFIAHANKRWTNRFIEPTARRLSGFATVAHTGRASGRVHTTPLYTFDADGEVIIALTYGPGADWAQNVLAAGGTLTAHGTKRAITDSSVVGRSIAWSHLPRPVRAALRILRVTDFMLLSTE